MAGVTDQKSHPSQKTPELKAVEAGQLFRANTFRGHLVLTVS